MKRCQLPPCPARGSMLRTLSSFLLQTLQSVAVLSPGRGEGTGPRVLLQTLPRSFMATHDFFAKITQIFDFLPFQILEKRPNLRLSLNVQKPKVL